MPCGAAGASERGHALLAAESSRESAGCGLSARGTHDARPSSARRFHRYSTSIAALEFNHDGSSVLCCLSAVALRGGSPRAASLCCSHSVRTHTCAACLNPAQRCVRPRSRRAHRMLAIANSYTYEEGERDHPGDAVVLRKIEDSDCKPKPKVSKG